KDHVFAYWNLDLPSGRFKPSILYIDAATAQGAGVLHEDAGLVGPPESAPQADSFSHGADDKRPIFLDWTVAARVRLGGGLQLDRLPHQDSQVAFLDDDFPGYGIGFRPSLARHQGSKRNSDQAAQRPAIPGEKGSAHEDS